MRGKLLIPQPRTPDMCVFSEVQVLYGTGKRNR